MSGYHLKSVIDEKCVPCCCFQNCVIKDHFEKISENPKVDPKEVEKLNHCLFFRKL